MDWLYGLTSAETAYGLLGTGGNGRWVPMNSSSQALRPRKRPKRPSATTWTIGGCYGGGDLASTKRLVYFTTCYFQQLCGTKSQRHVLHNGNGQTRMATSTFIQLLSSETLTSSYFFKCCFMSTETIRTIRDGKTRAATSPFTQLLSSVNSSYSSSFSSFIVLYVHRHHKAY